MTAQRKAWIHEVKVFGGVRYGYTAEGILIPGTANRCFSHWATREYAIKKARAAGYKIVAGVCPLPNPTHEQREAYNAAVKARRPDKIEENDND